MFRGLGNFSTKYCILIKKGTMDATSTKTVYYPVSFYLIICIETGSLTISSYVRNKYLYTFTKFLEKEKKPL